MARSADSATRRRKLLGEIARLAEIAIFGTLSETYRTCGQAGCHCQGDGPKHGPHLNVSYRGEKGKTTGYYYYCVINNQRRLPQQNGQHGNCLSSALAILMRTVAMEFG